MKSPRPTKDVGGRKCWRPDSYYLGSAESPLCLLLSPAEELSSQKVLPLLHAVLKWNLLTDPLSLYGRRLCRTVPACCTGTTCLNVRAPQMFAAADILTLFSEKNKNLTRLISVLSLPFKFVQNHKSCPNSAASLLGL